MVLVKAKCIDCWEDLVDYHTEIKMSDEVRNKIKAHTSKGHAVQEIDIS